MDFSPGIKKSFKSHGSYNRSRRMTSSSGGSSSNLEFNSADDSEELPILHQEEDSTTSSATASTSTVNLSTSPHQQYLNTPPARPPDTRAAEIIVKVDRGAVDTDEDSTPERQRGVQRELSFRQGSAGGGSSGDLQDPPSRLIGQFLNKQRVNGGEISLDMDMEMDELSRASPTNKDYANLPPLAESPPLNSTRVSREIRVSFEPSSLSGCCPAEVDSVRRRYKDSPEGDVIGASRREPEVLRCTSNASFRAQGNSLARAKTKSRLLDPPEELERMSERIPKHSAQFRSGLIGRVIDEEEDDPLEIEDLPDEYMRNKINTITVLQWLGLFVILGALICTLAVRRLKVMLLADLQLWKWEVLLLVLICGRLVSGWGIRILVFFIERNFLLRKRVLYFVYGLRRGVQNCLWLSLVLLSWHYLFDKKVNRETNGKSHHLLKYVTKILICFVVANFIWLLKTLLVKVLASSFHVSAYFDRIQESLFFQYVIGTLSGPPLVEIQRNEEEMERTAAEVRKLQNAGATMPPDLRAAVFQGYKSGRILNPPSGGMQQRSFIAGKSFKFSRQLSKKTEKKAATSGGDEGITIEHLHQLNTKNVSAWNMKRLMRLVRHGTLSTLDEQILGENDYEDESGTEIRNEHQAKAAARKIFYNVARAGNKYIYLEDLMRFMREDEAMKTMSFFEGASESGKISKGSLKNWVVNVFRERRALALTLNDTKTAVNRLHKLINILVSIIIVAIWLVILGIATSKFLVFLGSQVVVVSFIFGNTAKTLFECIIFLFFVHPFDVGDRCEVDAVQMIVEEMNILTTVFLRADNQKIVYPNSVLFTKPIGNFYRSPDMGDSVEFFVHIATPMDKIAVMKQRILSYMDSRKEHWYPNPMVILKEVDDMTRLRMAVWMRHRINHQDMGEKWGRRAQLLEEMIHIFKELDIQYRLHPLDVNVRTLPSNFTSSSPL